MNFSALTISTGDSLTASQILEELKSSQIEESIIRKRFLVGDVVQCQITGEIGEIQRTYTIDKGWSQIFLRIQNVSD